MMDVRPSGRIGADGCSVCQLSPLGSYSFPFCAPLAARKRTGRLNSASWERGYPQSSARKAWNRVSKAGCLLGPRSPAFRPSQTTSGLRTRRQATAALGPAPPPGAPSGPLCEKTAILSIVRLHFQIWGKFRKRKRPVGPHVRSPKVPRVSCYVQPRPSRQPESSGREMQASQSPGRSTASPGTKI